MRGNCLCGGVEFEVDPPLRDVIACHCSQCRKTSGHYWAATSVAHDRFRLISDATLDWYESSPSARRGFCRCCGASLFWQPVGEARISFAPGPLEGPTGLTVAEHIFTEDAGDYYAPEGPPLPKTEAPDRLTASCLCGSCAFTLPRPAGGVGACHCGQCRKLSGHYSASFDVPEALVEWQSRSSLAEFVTPGGGQRGFCTSCGSSLYFRDAEGGFSVEAGAVDGPTGASLDSHIFVADKGDYYRITDGLPQFQGWD